MNPPSSPPTRAALFVDFDNIFITLGRTDPAVAQRFAQDPLRWLRWLERGGQAAGSEAAPAERRVLVRRCYLNPQTFHEFRPYFIRSGFEVIDCPPLTLQGKTSADVMMALDIVDALAHPADYQEYLLFSGDADFTPVLVRLRKYDRRITVLAAGPSAAAYKAACDRLIEEDEFLEHGLGIRQEDRRQPTAPRPVKNQVALLTRIGARLFEAAGAAGALSAVSLPALYKEFPEFTRGDNWLGYFSLRAMTEAVCTAQGQLVLQEGDPWWVARREDGLDGVPAPTPAVKNGRVEEEDRFARELPEVADLARRIHDLTETPYLAPDRYATVLREIAKEVNQNGFDATQTSKAVRDGCYGKGVAVSRANVSFLMKGLLYSGYRWRETGHEDPYTLGQAVVRNTITLARRTQFDLTPAQEQLVRYWILGGLEEPEALPLTETA